MNRERGSVSVLVVAAVVLGGMLCLALARFEHAATDKARANTAADAAALAAADALARGHSPVEARAAARRTAAANGATLLACRCAGVDAVVTVALRDARSRARARVSPSSG